MKGKANIIVGAVVAVVVVAAIVAYVLLQGVPAGGGGGEAGPAGLRALVHDGDGAVWELPLSEDAERTVTTSLGTNVVVVEEGSVFVRDADCDNHDCVHQGKISSPGRQIICLPHKLWIEVVADDGTGGQMDEGAVAGDGRGSGSSEDLDAVAR